MHRFILDVVNPELEVDHKNNDPLDNRKENMRICSKNQNRKNKSSNKNSTSKFSGVSQVISRGGKKQVDGTYLYKTYGPRWQANIQVNKKPMFLGNFPFTPEGEIEAAKAHDTAAKVYFEEFAHLNFP